MNDREKILNQITANKPTLVGLPEIVSGTLIQYDDLALQFKREVESNGGNLVEVNALNILKDMIRAHTGEGLMVMNTIPELGEVHSHLQFLSADILSGVDTAYITSSIAVAENGAVWLYESQMINRLLPFICQHLVLVIERKNIVATMHHAYALIDTAIEGFGVFIAGPSKTADIEQSLVIGAHGAKSLTVYVI